MRTIVGVVGGAWLLLVAGLLGLRWVEGGVVVVALQCALPVAGASLVLLLVVALWARRWLLTVLTAVLLVPMLILAWPWWVQPELRPPGRGDTVVMASNLLFGQGEIEAVEQAVRRVDVDALVLLEVTPQALQEVEASGIPQALPYRSGGTRLDAGGTVVFTAQPHSPEPGTPTFFFDQVVVRVEPESETGRSWLLFGAHPVPPTLPQWSEELRALGDWQRAQGRQTPVVMAGDFNASSGHPALRRLQTGMTDAQQRTAPGWVRTWPRGRLVPAFVGLDHVLVRGWEVVDAGQERIPGSDHDAVWARLG
ncbi:MAG TPA: endonuclease/exonuclease/phosphatase family protein [Ornithinimicrobium sp.]|uniref:endonuclease/exonuclease/phosphatase family protein n=1 Tax=Ornithinimicrobium sp. TaxID=1977084 RepID=UPI002B45D246|nr:endonuclease/exonuclease/phosphatase family protein [Ornithinimicrobium sp.]HKJ10964.1 endonuclease/exonuclease/phosphatase family protein [Ornithinimicrobium sp.]